MKRIYQRLWYVLGIVSVSGTSGCVDVFDPPTVSNPPRVLVVDGHINPTGVSTIRLSRAVALRATDAVPMESQAQVYIEQEDGRRFALQETAAGTYTSALLQLPEGKRVRLHLLTREKREYASDYTPVLFTPEIDKVEWEARADGLHVLASTHDPTNQLRYYRWKYDETWEFTSAYYSELKYENGMVVERDPKDNIYNCWASNVSSDIRTGTAERLTQAVVSRAPVTWLPPSSAKLKNRYSIRVQQYALTAEEYSFLEKLRKNTENLGTIYDALPSESVGNIHCLTDITEPVLGFVGAQSVTEKRIFIGGNELPRTWIPDDPYSRCRTDTLFRPSSIPSYVPPLSVLAEYFQTGEYVPIRDLNPVPNSPTPFWLFSSADCVDCRRRGTNVKPSFWR